MYALVDVNSFYAACETLFRPDLKNRPVIVLSNNDGCVVARNAQAKQAGIARGEPFFKIRQRVERYGVQVFSSNYALYADMSARVMAILEGFAPAVECYSIDEAFLDLSGVADLHALGCEIRRCIKRDTGLTVGVGIAPSKTLAKLANHAAKRWPATGGVVDLSDPARQRRLLAMMPPEEVWGIGRRLGQRIHTMGITSALALAQSDLWFIRKNFNVVLERTVRELRGESCLAFEEFAPVKQEIISSRSFAERLTEYDPVREAVCAWAARAAEKLRGERQYCRYVATFIKNSPHDRHQAYYSNSAGIRLLTPTQDTRDITAAAIRALDAVWKPGPRYLKVGVMLGDFYSRGVAQLNLFDSYAPRANGEKLMQALDAINRQGRGKIWFAGQGTGERWAMKRAFLSPCYTTRYGDLPVAG
ncbi:translesion error-prone DNA polymerase V subunit UmuC [Enterobacteriaceae bacterium BIT-l23]|uniref:translesion error-prone DNA polymerase V subunit UmuC n=1 Tax=Jejubacter sp. L23 TaxID=3092086 RepID=UPI00158491DA|nr:translesion error-prone DNA polymerase V subunit UmuC [Enterobacteriaceae bacterium BIT-l23]